MGTSVGMIAQARLLLGLGEYPPGSNRNKVTVWLKRGDMPWCDSAIVYEAAHSDNLAAVCGEFVWTVAHARAFKAHGRWHYGLGGARPATWSSSTGRAPAASTPSITSA